LSRSSETIRSISLKYSSCIRAGRSGLFGGDQFVAARAQVLKDEILLCRRALFVDLLRPLLQRHLDAEGLVDREGDVEKVEAVDAQIIDRVTFRRDLLTRNIARLRNDVGDGVECP